jgi:hypothetical protein
MISKVDFEFSLFLIRSKISDREDHQDHNLLVKLTYEIVILQESLLFHFQIVSSYNLIPESL